MTDLRTVRVRYHFEDEGWWADSEDLQGWTAAGSDYAGVREQVRAGIPEFVGGPVTIVEEGVPEAPLAGVWRALSGANATPTLVVRFGLAASIIPFAPQSNAGVGPGTAVPDDDLDSHLVHAN